MNSYTTDSDEEMKCCNEPLNASSLQFFRSIECYIATIFYSAINASSPLLFYRDSLLNASSQLLLKVTLPTSDDEID
jgi:hypothetical protein